MSLKAENERLKVHLAAKDAEMKKLEVNLLRAKNMTFGS